MLTFTFEHDFGVDVRNGAKCLWGDEEERSCARVVVRACVAFCFLVFRLRRMI